MVKILTFLGWVSGKIIHIARELVDSCDRVLVHVFRAHLRGTCPQGTQRTLPFCYSRTLPSRGQEGRADHILNRR